jgi:hypothetical protein
MSSRPAGAWIEVVATVLLAVAAVLTAWCGYQATRWNGEQAKTASAVAATRFEASQEADLANAQTQVDVATFVQWVDAYARDDEQLQAFYLARFREEFKPVVEAWIAEKPLKNPDAALTPFQMPEYKVAAREQAAALDRQADVLGAKVRTDIQRASNYVLGAVMCAVTLFFAGMGTKLTQPRLRVAMISLGAVIFLGTLVWVLTLPVSFAV